MIGKLLADSGGADRIVDRSSRVGRRGPAVGDGGHRGASSASRCSSRSASCCSSRSSMLVARRTGLPGDAGRHPGPRRPLGAARSRAAAPGSADRDRLPARRPRPAPCSSGSSSPSRRVIVAGPVLGTFIARWVDLPIPRRLVGRRGRERATGGAAVGGSGPTDDSASGDRPEVARPDHSRSSTPSSAARRAGFAAIVTSCCRWCSC